MDINVENLSDEELSLLIDKIAEARENRKRKKKEYFLSKLQELWKDIEKAGFNVYATDDEDYYTCIYLDELNIK